MEGHDDSPDQSSISGLNLVRFLLIEAVFVIGATGNVAALWILHKSAKTRNRKHVLMLRCLATNDLVAQVGMFWLGNAQKFKLVEQYWNCVGYVVMRAFGIGSGCVAFVMALERWLALTRPFLYQQIVTFRMVKRLLFCFWCGGALLTNLPLFGFGLYYTGEKCARYRLATTLSDKVYAYLFFAFGSCLCICIAICNLTVIWELSRIRSQGKVLVRRVSRSIITNRKCAVVKYQTPEEVAFAKLMAILCIIFVSCWAPQMILIPLGQFAPESSTYKIAARISDILMCVYLTLDPYVYVLQQYREKGKFMLPCCFTRQRSMSSLPTTTTTVTGTPTSVLLNPPTFTVPDADM